MNYLTYSKLGELLLSVPDSEDLERFITDRGYEPWMEAYIDEDRNGDTVADILTVIWHTARGGFPALFEITGMSMTQFARAYHIPFRTVQNWATSNSAEKRTAPDYVTYLILYAYIMQTYPPHLSEEVL